jgi:branched-chain amino acid transport system ATP-binding protein
LRAGLVHVVEGHRVFTQLTVFDNLLLAGYGLPRREREGKVEEALAFFPEIAAKRNDRAVTLSGGQQQMLAVAQGLVRHPRLLMLDEPSAGSPRFSSTGCSQPPDACAMRARRFCWSNN